jgi:hypothetical protein
LVILPQSAISPRSGLLPFFDDDEPRTTRTGPRKAAGAGIASVSDPQQLLVRRLIAAGVGLAFVLVLVFGVNGCLDSRKEQALKDYNRDVASLVGEADSNTDEFFNALTTTGTSPVEVQSQISQFRQRAKSQTNQAKGFSVPSDMKPAQRSLLLSLGLLEETMGKIAEKVLSALSNDSATAEPAVVSITGEMQAFLAADVVYKRRTVALVKQVLDDNEIGGQSIQTSEFLPNFGWLEASIVARRINADAARGAGAGATSKEAAPGTHGHGLLGVSVGDVTLTPGQANRIPASSNVTFSAKVANQGENPETDVVVMVTITPTGGGKDVMQRASIDQTAAGSEATVQIPLKQSPPIGAAKVKVEVRKVNGEENTKNNSQEYAVNFER